MTLGPVLDRLPEVNEVNMEKLLLDNQRTISASIDGLR